MSRASGVPVMDLVQLARDLPDVFDSIWHHVFEGCAKADWKLAGESMADARDRMKRERAAAKAALG